MLLKLLHHLAFGYGRLCSAGAWSCGDTKLWWFGILRLLGYSVRAKDKPLPFGQKFYEGVECGLL